MAPFNQKGHLLKVLLKFYEIIVGHTIRSDLGKPDDFVLALRYKKTNHNDTCAPKRYAFAFFSKKSKARRQQITAGHGPAITPS